jgi:hypothetical protein
MDTFEQYFAKYYGFLRRKFWDYVTVVGGKNYFTWATVTLKVPSSGIGYYLDKMNATAAKQVSGHLDADLSDFYLREIPVVFNNQSDGYFQSFLGGEAFSLKRVGDIVVSLTIWLPGKGYTTVYVPYDPNQMEIKGHAFTLEQMGDAVASIDLLQVQLQSTAGELMRNHNTTCQALETSQYGDEAYASLVDTLKVVSENIMALRDSDAFLVKLSPDCDAVVINESIFGGAIIINAAIAFSSYTILRDNPSIAQTFTQGLAAQDTLSSMVLNGTKETILAVNSGKDGGTVQTATPTPDGVNNANKKSNAIWWVLGIGAAVYVISNSGPSTPNGKPKK